MNLKTLFFLPFFLLLFSAAVQVVAQTPNTAAMIVIVVDQTGAVVKDAKVSVLNTAVDECDSGVCQHRSAEDVSDAGAGGLLSEEKSLKRRRFLKRQVRLETLVATGDIESHHEPQKSEG